jgi:hypothetical protein
MREPPRLKKGDIIRVTKCSTGMTGTDRSGQSLSSKWGPNVIEGKCQWAMVKERHHEGKGATLHWLTGPEIDIDVIETDAGDRWTKPHEDKIPPEVWAALGRKGLQGELD